MATPSFAARLLRWYDANRRDLPWRRTRDPWAILVSEIMLQQTRVEAVREPYARFLARYPRPSAFAAIGDDELLTAWRGLGYYRRARLLREAARTIRSEHGDRLPADPEALRELPGIAVLDADTLVVAELTSNTLLTVDRTNADTVGFFAGEPNVVPGFADGLATGTAGRARFSFTEPAQLCPTGDAPPRVFVADPGNHAVRVVSGNSVRTVSGGGTALFSDGDLGAGFFDTPTGVVVTCDDRLLVSERGANGFGNRLRLLSIGASSPFGGFFGSVSTLAGDGTNATTAGPSLAGAQLARPVAPHLCASGEIYWIDQDTGVLRRRLADGSCDCPLHMDCADAVTTPDFTPFHAFSLAETAGGKLYVLDATIGSLVRVTP
mgnify:CR=1 FL=1